ncbi:MAG: hypothetical protein LBC67_03245 [Spirochaetales bacterium]|nr:hypothetical protein [Spirochaetales bacterium]
MCRRRTLRINHQKFPTKFYGVAAGLAAGMKVVAIPTLTAPPLDPVFEGAAILYPKGIGSFTASGLVEKLQKL